MTYFGQVGEETSIAATNCLCNHATFFGSLNVKPNPIGPLSYAKLKDGYAMLVFVSIIFALYFLALIWARRKDRADVVRVSVNFFEYFPGGNKRLKNATVCRVGRGLALVNSDLFGKKGRKRSERENKDQVNLHDDDFFWFTFC